MRVFLTLSMLAVPVLMSSIYENAFAQDPSAAPRNSHRLIITDVDDTVKVTDVSHALDSLVRATFGRKAFAGISTLYQEMGSHDSSDLFEHSTLYFVSGGPEIFRNSVVGMISQNHFPAPWSLTMRENLSQPTLEYKVQKISAIIEGLASEDRVVLVGDDGEKDPETYAEILRKYPNRVDGVYIHRIQGRSLPAGEIGYDTPMDIAILEMEKGLLKPEQAVLIGKAVLSEGKSDDERLVMRYSYCPMTDELQETHASSPVEQEAYSLSSQIRKRLKQICQDRLDDAEHAKLYYYSG
jgi:hypothetical protein